MIVKKLSLFPKVDFTTMCQCIQGVLYFRTQTLWHLCRTKSELFNYAQLWIFYPGPLLEYQSM